MFNGKHFSVLSTSLFATSQLILSISEVVSLTEKLNSFHVYISVISKQGQLYEVIYFR